MINISKNHPLTLAGIFLEVLEQMSKDEKFKAYVRKVKVLMDVPECAEYLTCGLMNAMGNPTPIASTTVDKAIDCLIHSYENNIEENHDWTREQKDVQKGLMRKFMSEYRNAVKNFISFKNLLK